MRYWKLSRWHIVGWQLAKWHILPVSASSGWTFSCSFEVMITGMLGKPEAYVFD